MKVASKIERLLDAGAVIEWRPVKGFENLYAVSNEGDVKSLARIDSRGHRVGERILKPAKGTPGYLTVTIYKGGGGKTHHIHQLVARAFIGECPDGYEVNHINEEKIDNRLNNLEYVTRKQNLNHGTHNARMVRALSMPIESFDLKTGKTIKRYASAREAERQDGYNRGNIWSCLDGRYKMHGGVGWRRQQQK